VQTIRENAGDTAVRGSGGPANKQRPGNVAASAGRLRLCRTTGRTGRRRDGRRRVVPVGQATGENITVDRLSTAGDFGGDPKTVEDRRGTVTVAEQNREPVVAAVTGRTGTVRSAGVVADELPSVRRCASAAKRPVDGGDGE